MQKDQIIIHTDGGSRGNPGPSACAFVVEKDGQEIYKASKYLGIETNNYAEYNGVILALEWISKEPQFSNSKLPIIFYSDSELIVRQLIGLYKIKNETLKLLSEKAKKIINENNLEVTFENIPREKNKIADLLVNIELDGKR